MYENADNNNVHDKRKVKLDKVLSKDYIPFMEGRPDREKVIGRDDMINLSITLNTLNSIDELIKEI